ncbi:LytTR family transcriptional regulator DNA-binding domain-containing protein [Siminovitchia sp. FSL H7-0308]|uniref:LytTR family DNA-binding domain-containing protein n=1 Tax=Siminovitchia sp. FSL H7-0308 TaxID=2921432 RepID=UPI0030ECF5FE
MKVKIDIDDLYENTSITIQTNEWTDELEQLVSFIKKEKPKRLFGVEEDQTIVLDPETIDYIYAEKRKVYAALENGRRLEVKMKLFEVENLLGNSCFTRFSKSVIGNVNRIQRFELSFNGNLCVYFSSGNKEYITRKYVASVKEKLTSGGPANDI